MRGKTTAKQNKTRERGAMRGVQYLSAQLRPRAVTCTSRVWRKAVSKR